MPKTKCTCLRYYGTEQDGASDGERKSSKTEEWGGRVVSEQDIAGQISVASLETRLGLFLVPPHALHGVRDKNVPTDRI